MGSTLDAAGGARGDLGTSHEQVAAELMGVVDLARDAAMFVG